jgi:hypothetical protein
MSEALSEAMSEAAILPFVAPSRRAASERAVVRCADVRSLASAIARRTDTSAHDGVFDAVTGQAGRSSARVLPFRPRISGALALVRAYDDGLPPPA